MLEMYYRDDNFNANISCILNTTSFYFYMSPKHIFTLKCTECLSRRGRLKYKIAIKYNLVSLYIYTHLTACTCTKCYNPRSQPLKRQDGQKAMGHNETNL